VSFRLIELQDHNLRISSPQGALGKSPGFANTAGSNPVFGQTAFEQFRLHPNDSFTHYWSSLSLDPLVKSNKHFRHHADIAYAHLNDLSQEHELKDDVIFAIPSHYSRNQLATLLGIARHCPFKLTGLVDLPLIAVAKAMPDSAAEAGLYLDFQLHQAVVTRFVAREGFLQRESIVQIPACGLMALRDAWSNLIAEVFIKQSRFNPQHNADTEQYIFNQLQTWLAELTSGRELSLSINNKGTIYQARLNAEAFELKVRNIYSRIQIELIKIKDTGTALFLPASMAALPGFIRFFPDSISLYDDASLENCLQHTSLLKSDSDALKLHIKLPLPKMTSPIKSHTESLPSHFLFRHKAYPLQSDIDKRVGSHTINGRADSGMKLPGLAKHLNIRFEKQTYMLYPESDLELRLNGTKLTAPASLQIGDCISLDETKELIHLIQVQ